MRETRGKATMNLMGRKRRPQRALSSPTEPLCSPWNHCRGSTRCISTATRMESQRGKAAHFLRPSPAIRPASTMLRWSLLRSWTTAMTRLSSRSWVPWGFTQAPVTTLTGVGVRLLRLTTTTSALGPGRRLRLPDSFRLTQLTRSTWDNPITQEQRCSFYSSHPSQTLRLIRYLGYEERSVDSSGSIRSEGQNTHVISR